MAERVTLPKGVIKLPWTLTEQSPGVTLSDGTPNAEAEVVVYQIPRNMSIACKPGSRFWFMARSTVPADLTRGIVRIYLADSNRATKFKVFEAPFSAVNAGASGAPPHPEASDREKRALLPSGFARGSDEYLIITYEDLAGETLDDAEIRMILEGVQFIKI